MVLDSTNVIYAAMAKDLLGQSLESLAGDLARKAFVKHQDKLVGLGIKGYLDFSK